MSEPQTNTTTADATGADSQNSGTDATVTTSAAITFTTEAEFQKRVDDMLKERLERERKKAADAAQKAREEAEQEAAAKNGEWQKLAEQHGAKVKELTAQFDTLSGQVETLTAQKERLETALRAQLENARKDLPKPVLSLLEKQDIVDQLEWLATNRAELQRANGVGVPSTPRPAGALNGAASEEARRATAAMYSEF